MYKENIDYKSLYLKMFRATEEAMRILIDVQRECEELYLSYYENEEKATTSVVEESA